LVCYYNIATVFTRLFPLEKVSLNNQGRNAARFFLCSYYIIATVLTRLSSRKSRWTIREETLCSAQCFFLCSYYNI